MVISVVVSRACAGCEAKLPLCSVTVAALSGVGLFPSCWIRTSEGQFQSGSIALECMPCPKGGEC